MNILKINPKPGQGVYVYEFPVRLWHWTIVACIFTLFVTGHYIGKPPQTLTGDPTKLFYFGYLIMAHYIAAMILCVAMLCRIIWAFFGNPVSRQIFILKIWQKSWWQGMLDDIKWYLFINKSPAIRMGHNPLAQAGMFVCVVAIIFMCLTGLGIYQAKGYYAIPHLFKFMEDFVYWHGGNGLDLVVWHRMGMVILVAFVMIHIYMVIREEIMGKTTMISTMVNGYRLVKASMLQDWKEEETSAKKSQEPHE